MSLPTSERFFPPPTARKDKCRRTLVFWIIEDEPVPSKIEFWSICENIEPALSREGYRGKTKFEGFLLNPNKEIPQEHWNDYKDYGIEISMDPEGDEVIRYNKMLIYLTFWAFNVSWVFGGGFLSNLLVLSSNKNIGQDPKFSRLRETLENIGIHVAVAHPDTVKNLDKSGIYHTEEDQSYLSEFFLRVDEEC